MDLEFMILDTFDQIRPSFCKFQSEEEANEACKKIQEAEKESGSYMYGNDSGYSDRVQRVINGYVKGSKGYEEEEDDYWADKPDD